MLNGLRAGGSSGGDREMDFNINGYFWGMPVNFSGEAAAEFYCMNPENISSIAPNVTTAAPWHITLGAALLGALVGGFITFIITYAKARAEMKWGFKQNAVIAIINELDQSEARTPRTNRAIHRRVGHIIHIAFTNTEIRTTADRIIDQNTELAELQRIIDDELMPLVETDLEETMDNWWKPWKW